MLYSQRLQSTEWNRYSNCVCNETAHSDSWVDRWQIPNISTCWHHHNWSCMCFFRNSWCYCGETCWQAKNLDYWISGNVHLHDNSRTWPSIRMVFDCLYLHDPLHYRFQYLTRKCSLHLLRWSHGRCSFWLNNVPFLCKSVSFRIHSRIYDGKRSSSPRHLLGVWIHKFLGLPLLSYLYQGDFRTNRQVEEITLLT